jgi:hypothetical protein
MASAILEVTMKKLLLSIALLAISFPVYALEPIDFSQPIARMSVGIVGAGGAAAAASTFCTSGTVPADFCEDFDGTSLCFTGFGSVCRSSTMTNMNDGGGVNPITLGGTRPSGIGCNDSGVGYIDMNHVGGYSHDFFDYEPATSTAISVLAYWYFQSASSWADTNSIFLLQVNRYGPKSGMGCWTKLWMDGTAYKFRACYINSSDAEVCTDGTASPTVTAGNWYPIRLTFDPGALCKVEIDLNNDGDFSDANEVVLNQTTSLQAFTYIDGLSFGDATGPTFNYRIGFDNITWKYSTTSPDLCTR